MAKQQVEISIVCPLYNEALMKGIFAWVRFKFVLVGYARETRQSGKTRFNFWKLWNLAVNGIITFKSAPLGVWYRKARFFTFLLSFLYGCSIIRKTMILGGDVPGCSSLFTIILFLGRIQLTCTGVIGEYIGRIYLESKRPPTYIIEASY